jgi:hypothetical protein
MTSPNARSRPGASKAPRVDPSSSDRFARAVARLPSRGRSARTSAASSRPQTKAAGFASASSRRAELVPAEREAFERLLAKIEKGNPSTAVALKRLADQLRSKVTR